MLKISQLQRPNAAKFPVPWSKCQDLSATWPLSGGHKRINEAVDPGHFHFYLWFNMDNMV